MKDQKNKLRLTTFLPPFIILSLFVALSIINQEKSGNISDPGQQH